MIYSIINKVAWVFVWIFFLYLVSVPIRIVYDSIKKGWLERKMNKKSTVQDVGVAMIIFFVAVIVFFVVTYSYGEFVDRAVNNSVINSSIAAVTAFNDSKALTERLDYVSLVLLIGFILAIIITGWFVGGNQLFAFIYLIVLVLLIVTSSIFSYVWNQVSTKPMFAATLTKFPIADYILSNFPLFITIIGFIGMLVMFAKPYLQNGGGEY